MTRAVCMGSVFCEFPLSLFQGEKVRSATDEVRRFIRGKVMSASFRNRDFIGRGSGVPQPRSEISRGSQEFLRQGQKLF